MPETWMIFGANGIFIMSFQNILVKRKQKKKKKKKKKIFSPFLPFFFLKIKTNFFFFLFKKHFY